MNQTSTLRVRVRNIKDETSTIKRFTLESMDYSKLPPYSGGSHITTFLSLPSGTLERQYSLFNTTLEPGLFEIAVRLAEDSTGGSRFWHQNVQAGDALTVSFPKNYFPLSFQAKHHVFYAAGIGITPFLSMMAELAEKEHSFELHYAANSKEQCAFYEHLRTVYPDRCRFYFSNSEGTKRLSPKLLLDHRIGTHVYFCGPERMIEDFTNAAKSYGYPSFNIHWERFAPPVNREHKPFSVNLQRSGRQFEVPANTSLLDVLRKYGINVPYSCRVGGCGTCEVKVAEGEVFHYDSFLTEEQRCSKGIMLSCVSRGKGKLVLDL
ncbi:PDR/VanB family oxidoreductase [Mesobacillus subterraneus]|uniref:PDR/VanB family oxidoreductase n=1 Tax=Mesobacillus subterraneus TaxID=285983 RepID=UPI00204180F5|nr:PDR/VanB family oxidoreductase [Mesobacillus subterraneus]MCM3664483.1 PDR/VanB family oxidoreductase [Mesobacillus subterraneus]MCM3684000.1 PDR/VanB family oxidoreductase [Mesobacillus subterraneus]